MNTRSCGTRQARSNVGMLCLNGRRHGFHIGCTLGVQNKKPKLCYVGRLNASEGMSPEKVKWAERASLPSPPALSKPDEAFHRMGLEFVEMKDGIVLTELNELFEKVGFPRRDPVKLKTAIDNTYALIWVRSTKQSRLARLGQMVAIARATSDGALSATIWDVAVQPSWQRSGLGRAMMERLVRNLMEKGIPTITLYAEPNVVGLYEKLGFVQDPDGIRGMAFQRKKKERHALAASAV
ncbi:hypothetical protein CEUSTIGMA_g10477.t1 [Chlamydomonas eustigma]|uniref:N-acetyltransferase domain-containing protein n=1 Tax=Chlamydomonas eustigma TaxID=1157962 RepID=A0A250XIY9_9CHLO|nr:hypothetical protein CEUSTIGMA_g10477.t1 [Chlamydomonas eustigma]|eukprot:GAX83051.1 hypothetical protein CEUSTIGMA_g10477.t1 [Chlamydomonas eustigma]